MQIFPWKNRSLADFAAGIRRISAESGEGGEGIASPPISLPKSLFGQAEALRRFASGLRTVEKRRESMSGIGATGILIVAGGVNGGHGC